VLTDVLNKAYSNFVLVRDAKDAANLYLKANKASYNSVGILSFVKVLLKHRLYLVLGSSPKIGTSEDGLLSIFNRGEDKVEIHLVKLVVKALSVSIVEIRFSDLSVVTSGASGAGASSLA
jgi:hypothetical protein